MGKITTVGLVIGKRVLQVHAATRRAARNSVSRNTGKLDLIRGFLTAIPLM
jgi:hypothetical protein